MPRTRRDFLALTLAASTAAACRKRSTPVPNANVPVPSTSGVGKPIAKDPRENLDVLDWELPSEMGGDKRCTVLIPKPLPQGTKLPLLIALHGMGETVSPKVGSHGWLDAYELDRVLMNLRTPPLAEDAFKDLVKKDRLAEINADLQKRPFGGVVVACPYLPREIGTDVPYDLYAQWLGEKLIPKLRNEAPVVASTLSTGIDGVSLGGITALRIGLARADLFGVVGSLQAAVSDEGTDALAQTIESKLAGRKLQIITSSEDVYRDALASLSKKLEAKNIAHTFRITEGPHDYVWNKGPGGIEMMLFHDRTLARA